MALPISYNLRNLRNRWLLNMLAVGGIGLVVAVLVVLLSVSAGFRIALRSTGLTENAIVVQRGSMSELTSWVPLDHRNRIVVDERVARGADGQSLASPEIVVVASFPRRSDGRSAQVTVRGVTAHAFEVRGGIEIRRGRRFTPGLTEIMVGERVAERMRGFDIGSLVTIERQKWQVVGIFASRGGAFESEIWGDLDVMGPLFQRTNGSSSLVVRLRDRSMLAGFDKAIRDNPDMQLHAVEERRYYEDQAGVLATVLVALAGFVSLIMGIGAVFGAMNTMYAVVASRTREIGTLRALGFPRRHILFTFVVESVLLAVVGGILGCLLALPMDGFSTATGQTLSFSEVAFAFRITPPILSVALAFAAVMGFFGGLLPAWRAARLPITAALREA